MTYMEKILKEAKGKHVKVDSETRKGLEAIQEQHRLLKDCKPSASKVYEDLKYGKSNRK